MKMQVSLPQMQDTDLPESSKQLLSQIRNELNTLLGAAAELLTTFRLQLTEPAFVRRWRPAVRSSAPDSALPCRWTTSCRPALCLLTRRHSSAADRPGSVKQRAKIPRRGDRRRRSPLVNTTTRSNWWYVTTAAGYRPTPNEVTTTV